MTNGTNGYLASSAIWTGWIRESTTGTCITCPSWIVWNQTTATTSDPWPIWTASNATAAISSVTVAQAYQAGAPFSESPEEIRDRLRRADERLRRRSEADAQYLRLEGERKAARERAERLLMETLSDQQRSELAEKGYFTVHPNRPALIGERYHYRVRRGRSRNVERVNDSGRVLERLCAHPTEQVPDADTMLAQKFWIETREADFLRVANHS